MFSCRSLIVALLCFVPCFAAEKPKLVVGIVVDQFRYDYLTRFRSDYHSGLDRLLTNGANFTNAFYGQIPTVTAVGHSIFLSGAMPAVSGIVSNSWYDREARQVVTSVCDWSTKLVGAEQPQRTANCTDSDPASPRRMLVSTLGDELRDANEKAKVVGISIKARGAILPSGHRANGAYWFSDTNGAFVSSSYYYDDQLPEWATHFNHAKHAESYLNKAWEGFPSWKFETYADLPASPWGNELIEEFAEAAIAGEKLGQRGDATDLITISFSSNDYVGHRAGPDSPEVRDMAIRTDQHIGKLLDFIEKNVGLKQTIVVLSADHGVASSPAVSEERKMPGGYVAADAEDVVDSALRSRYGNGSWVIRGAGETTIYLDWERLGKAGAVPDDVYEIARKALLGTPLLHVVRVYTREELDRGIGGDFIATAAQNGYFPRRSGDLSLVLEPNYMNGTRGTTHFSPYAYDRHVPVLLMGPGIRAGRYDGNIQPNDIASTLATLLDIQTPSGSSGRVLTECLTER